MKTTAYAAELLGAFALTLLVWLSLAYKAPLATPIIAALTVGTFVYTVGTTSGAHLNPAVTIGLLSIGKINKYDAAMYILAQVIGAGLAMIIGQMLTGGTIPPLPVENTLPIGVAESIGAFLLCFGIASVVYKKTPGDIAGVVIGASLLLGILVASSVSNGILNPAVAMGLKSVSVMYILGPVVGAIVGFWAYRWLIGAK